jgi:cellulose synthase/poly-beta-1,6-N-acetylglucosamine synthase-like glycosyltransferase
VKTSLGIVLPVCNVEATLRRNVQYLLEIIPDLVARFELMIVDDGSTDQTDEIAQDLAREYPQIRVVRHNQPQGLEASIESALPHLASEAVYVHAPDRPLRSAALQAALRSELRVPPALATSLPQRWSAWEQAMESAAEQQSAPRTRRPSGEPPPGRIRRAARS